MIYVNLTYSTCLLIMTEWDNVCETITNTFYTNCSLVFIILFFGQLKNWVGQVLLVLVVRRDKLKKNMLM